MKTEIKVQTKFISDNFLIKIANERFFLNIANLVRLTRAKRALDCGCGEGVIIKELRKRIKGIKFEGFDIDRKSVILARKINPKLKFKQASVYKIPYSKSAFPLILCTEVLEHLKNPQKALKELRRVSSQDLIISVPHEPFFRMMNVLRLKYLKKLGNTPGHLNHWSPFKFKEILKQDFIIKKEAYPFPWMMFWVRKKHEKR